jgi:hypothetical protein
MLVFPPPSISLCARVSPERDQQPRVRIAVVALFALTCLGRLVALEVALQSLVVNEAFGGRAGSS